MQASVIPLDSLSTEMGSLNSDLAIVSRMYSNLRGQNFEVECVRCVWILVCNNGGDCRMMMS